MQLITNYLLLQTEIKGERKKEERKNMQTHLSLFVFAPHRKMQIFFLRLGANYEQTCS